MFFATLILCLRTVMVLADIIIHIHRSYYLADTDMPLTWPSRFIYLFATAIIYLCVGGVAITSNRLDNLDICQGGEEAPARPLQRNFRGLALVVMYTSLLLFTWTTTCVLSHRPVTYPSYDTSFSTLRGWGCQLYNSRGYAGVGCGGNTKDMPITAS
jgi:hypothetical protein